MKIYDKFIGDDNAGNIVKYAGSDTLEDLERNLPHTPEDWYYKNIDITYDFNEYGHRCKSIKNIDLDNYVLLTGCSNTAGCGLEYEKSYPYLLGKSRNCDYYNLSLIGTGLDVLEYNLLTWLNTVEKKPKFIIIQWPDPTRFADYDKERDNLIPVGTWASKKNDHYKKFFASGDMSGFFTARRHLITRLLRQVITVPIYTISLSNLVTSDHYSIPYRILDRARDLYHPGIKSHEALHKLLLENIAINI